jgi:hypothetical protein
VNTDDNILFLVNTSVWNDTIKDTVNADSDEYYSALLDQFNAYDTSTDAENIIMHQYSTVNDDSTYKIYIVGEDDNAAQYVVQMTITYHIDEDEYTNIPDPILTVENAEAKKMEISYKDDVGLWYQSPYSLEQ